MTIYEIRNVMHTHADLDKCRGVMETYIPHTTDDVDLILQASAGTMKSINVPDKEMFKESGRKSFLLNQFDLFTHHATQGHRIAAIAAFSTFAFHLDALGWCKEHDAYNATLPESKQIPRSEWRA